MLTIGVNLPCKLHNEQLEDVRGSTMTRDLDHVFQDELAHREESFGGATN